MAVLLALSAGVPTLASAQGREATGRPSPPPRIPTAPIESPPPASTARAPGSTATFPPATTVGSLTPDVYFEELQWPLRDNVPLSCAYLSPHDPEAIIAVSNDGHAFHTADGGKTWDEVRAIVSPQAAYFGDAGQRMFYGATRRSPSPTAYRFSPPRALPGTTPNAPGFSGLTLWNIGTPHHPVKATRSRHLPTLVNRFGRPPRGGEPADQFTAPVMSATNHIPTSRKELIALKGQRNPDIWFPIYHPYDPNITWLVTYYGLYTSENGGRDYFRTFIGTGVQGREIFEVMVNPNDHSHLWLSTGEGTYVSTDGGRNYIRHTGKGIGDWIAFGYFWHPTEKNVMYATTNFGLLRSKDNGENFEIIYYTAYRPARTARNLSIDPFRPNVALLTTFDGVFITHDIVNGGPESWQRFAPLQFTSTTYLRGVYHCPKHRGHIWVVANLRMQGVKERGTQVTGHSFLWESVNYGETWKPVYGSNQYGRITWAIQDPWDPDLFLIAADRALVRMRRRSPNDPPPVKRIRIPDDPPITNVIQAALRNTLTAPHILLSYRSRARLRSLLPDVELSYQNYNWRYLDLMHDGRYRTLPFKRWDRLDVPYNEFRVLFLWNLGDLVFNTHRFFGGREFRVLNQLREQIILEVHQAYGRLRQLRVQLARLPRSKLRQRLHYRTRIQETTALLNFLSGDYLARWYASRT